MSYLNIFNYIAFPFNPDYILIKVFRLSVWHFVMRGISTQTYLPRYGVT